MICYSAPLTRNSRKACKVRVCGAHFSHSLHLPIWAVCLSCKFAYEDDVELAALGGTAGLKARAGGCR